jgi:hypothetical protein
MPTPLAGLQGTPSLQCAVLLPPHPHAARQGSNGLVQPGDRLTVQFEWLIDATDCPHYYGALRVRGAGCNCDGVFRDQRRRIAEPLRPGCIHLQGHSQGREAAFGTEGSRKTHVAIHLRRELAPVRLILCLICVARPQLLPLSQLHAIKRARADAAGCDYTEGSVSSPECDSRR